MTGDFVTVGSAANLFWPYSWGVDLYDPKNPQAVVKSASVVELNLTAIPFHVRATFSDHARVNAPPAPYTWLNVRAPAGLYAWVKSLPDHEGPVFDSD
ncbi:hypothetical protein [Streptomyces sp. NPDC060027]|uniref:hypothetical protein n=1 Tax=Streptomyces sp. NPDC060027 TaxID=3347040 RepID=UPI00369580D5